MKIPSDWPCCTLTRADLEHRETGNITDERLYAMEVENSSPTRKEKVELVRVYRAYCEALKLRREGEGKVDESPFKLKAADKMAQIIDDMVRNGTLDARSGLADARLDYGEPFKATLQPVKDVGCVSVPAHAPDCALNLNPRHDCSCGVDIPVKAEHEMCDRVQQTMDVLARPQLVHKPQKADTAWVDLSKLGKLSAGEALAVIGLAIVQIQH